MFQYTTFLTTGSGIDLLVSGIVSVSQKDIGHCYTDYCVLVRLPFEMGILRRMVIDGTLLPYTFDHSGKSIAYL